MTADRFKVVFVTTDPARDTPQVLRAWLDHFDKRFPDRFTRKRKPRSMPRRWRRIWTPAKRSTARPDGNYEALGHALFVFAYTKDNLAHLVYPGGVQEED